MFCEAFLLYAKSKGLNVQFRVIDVPQRKSNRPRLTEVLNFLEEALGSDDGKDAFVDILDSGIIKKIDLGLWYDTTTLGGGFVYFTL